MAWKGLAVNKLLATAPVHLLHRATRPDPIFQIGFNRCATTSLHRFLCASGVRSLHWEKEILATSMAARIDAGQDPIRDFPRVIGFTDMVAYRPQMLVEPYKRFDYLQRWYPNALFILNTRDRENWVVSRAEHKVFGRRYLIDIYAEILGIPKEKVPDFWRAEWETHHILVRTFFSSDPNFLEFNIERDNSAKLSSFIASRYPQATTTPFVIHNKGRLPER
jgi:hypothetical protein